MYAIRNFPLAALAEKLDAFGIPLTIADVADEKQPLIYMNEAFSTITGYGERALGENCRFLQAGLDNGPERAEVRAAILERRRTQVVLENRRKNGEIFHNLLLLIPIGEGKGIPYLMMGAQFDLGDEHPERRPENDPNTLETAQVGAYSRAVQVRIERRRIVAEAAVRLAQSWLTISSVHGR
jgi:PAS domain S-box-containing protein